MGVAIEARTPGSLRHFVAPLHIVAPTSLEPLHPGPRHFVAPLHVVLYSCNKHYIPGLRQFVALT